MIDGFINIKYKVETGIPQRLSVYHIFFLIYIRGIFLEIEKQMLNITCLLFMDNLEFLIAGKSMLEIKKSLKKAEKLFWTEKRIM